MRFVLIDRVSEFTPGVKLAASKRLTLGEEYLADHFPSFPVMPGVLMLETLVQAGAWLIRFTEDFKPTLITLREVKGVKYGTFMQPGHTLNVAVEVQGDYDARSQSVAFKGSGEQGGQSVVSARFVLSKGRAAEQRPEWAEADAEIASYFRRMGTLLVGSAPASGGAAGAS